MDMKKILQAFDSTAAKPVEGASDMKRFVSIIQESNSPQVLNEGANPHKVTLPVQMAMQHYQKPAAKKPARPALIDKYFHQVQEEQLQEKQERRKLINQYAQTIAERVLMKESKGEGKWHTSPSGVKTNMSPSDDDYEINYGKHGAAAYEDYNPNVSPNTGFDPGPGGPGLMPNESHNPVDTVTLDIPLLVRMLEYAREDAKTDIEIHDVVERMIHMSEEGHTLNMDDYDEICNIHDVHEGKKIKAKKKTNPCWDGYQQIGMKKKSGKTVPNCVKKNSGN
jgi:hypothetical protein